MTSYYVTVSIKVFLNVGNDEYIILCNFGGHTIMSGFEVIDGGLQEPCPPVAKQQQQQQQQQIKKAGLKLIVKRHRLSRVVVTCYSVFTIATF